MLLKPSQNPDPDEEGVESSSAQECDVKQTEGQGRQTGELDDFVKLGSVGGRTIWLYALAGGYGREARVLFAGLRSPGWYW